ncbi:hypothetical protein M2284_004908 [Rhodococcus sp. LBL1]|nr:hypothetical protein [Rhodococcus sp. LBL1]MDH6686000.1 hypothetical protein [Rhodococcus sp. LBL2]
MSRLARIVPVLAALVCGAIAGRVLWSPLPDDYVRAESALPAALVTNSGGIAAAAAVAVSVTVVSVRRRSVTLVAATALSGLLLLMLPEVLVYPEDTAVLLYSNAVGAGLVLGAISPLAARDRDAQAGLAAGAVGAFLLSASFVEVRGSRTADFGWTAYTPLTSLEPAEQSGVVGLWPVVTAAVLVVLSVLLDRRTSWTARVDTRWLAAAAALPVAVYAVRWILMESGVQPEWWYLYVGLVTAVIAWIAWQLPGNDGRVVFAGAAVLAGAIGGTPSMSTNWWTVAIPAALIVAGVAVGVRWPVPTVGFGLLAVGAAASLVAPEQWDIPAVASMFLLPAAAGFVAGSCLPTSAPASTVGVALPFTVSIPGVFVMAGVIPERYVDYGPTLESQVPAANSVVVAALAVIVVCGVGAWGLDLRSAER